MDLPKPQAEQTPDLSELMPLELQAEAPATMATEQSPKASPSLTPAQQATLPVAQAQSGAPVQPLVGQPLVTNLPAIADDADLIEKEWVVKAKEIIGQTRHDPYMQNKEISKVKADYLKKRYNKDLKVSSE